LKATLAEIFSDGNLVRPQRIAKLRYPLYSQSEEEQPHDENLQKYVVDMVEQLQHQKMPKQEYTSICECFVLSL
jgi:ferritin